MVCFYGLDISDGELDVFSQVGDGQIGHTGAQDRTDQRIVV